MDKKKSFQSLLKYIDYFESVSNQIINNPSQENPVIKEFVSHYPVYDDELNTFIEAVYHSEILMRDYIGYLEEKFPGKQWAIDDIEAADLTTLRAMLTKCVRAERFYVGSWGKFARDGYFLAILRRLEKLLNKKFIICHYKACDDR